jgi:iron uptake system component EfeO
MRTRTATAAATSVLEGECVAIRCSPRAWVRRTAFAGALLAIGLASPAQAGSLDEAAARFKPYIAERIAESLAGTQMLRERIGARDLAGAQQAWLAARGGWESAEIVTKELFPELDAAIDPWPNAKLGFHAIEAKLFGAHQVDALPEADELVRHLTTFAAELDAATLPAQGLLNGTTKLAYEIGDDKAAGGESQFSGNSLDEMGYNLAGIRAAYHAVFEPSLKARNAKRAEALEKHLEELQSLIAVRRLMDLDQAQLRKLSEGLAADLVAAGQEVGLASPNLAD